MKIQHTKIGHIIASALGVKASGDEEATLARFFIEALVAMKRKDRVATLARMAVIDDEIGALHKLVEKAENRAIAAVADLVKHRMDWAIVQMHKDADPKVAQQFAAWCEELRGAILDGTWRVAIRKEEPEQAELFPGPDAVH